MTSACDDISEEKVFRTLLLLDFYNIAIEEVDSQLPSFLLQSFEDIEKWARSFSKSPPNFEALAALHPSELLLNINCKVSFEKATPFKINEVVLKSKDTHFFGRKYGNSRFLTVQ